MRSRPWKARARFTEQGYVPLFFAFALCLAAAGVEASRLFVRGWPKAALLLTLLSFAAATLVIALAIPSRMAK